VVKTGEKLLINWAKLASQDFFNKCY